MTADKDALLPCPFCGGECDPEGWLDGNGRRGPECNECGATADTVEDWNRRITAALAEKDDGGWIKVSERLPSHGERVQIVCEDADGDPYRTIATYNDNDYGPFIRDGGRKAKNPTHWQPLPPLPKERSE